MLARVGVVDNNISHVYVLASQLPGCYSRAVPAGGLPGRMVCGYAPPAISCGMAWNRTEQHTAPHQHRTEQNRTEQNRTEQNTTHHTTPHQDRTEQSRAEQKTTHLKTALRNLPQHQVVRAEQRATLDYCTHRGAVAHKL